MPMSATVWHMHGHVLVEVVEQQLPERWQPRYLAAALQGICSRHYALVGPAAYPLFLLHYIVL
jgi:hypothetical protein